MQNEMRFDLQVIASWIEDGSRVLDLGCGNGDLLLHLKSQKKVRGTGIERQEDKVSKCLQKGLTVIHGDIYQEVLDYPDNAFDYVVLSQTLQQVYEPETLIFEMLRIGHNGVVSFPNFSHYYNRMQFFFLGRAPISRQLPYPWYDTPNIRVIAIKDFVSFCRISGFKILQEVAIKTHHHDTQGKIVTIMPNLFAAYGIFLLSQG